MKHITMIEILSEKCKWGNGSRKEKIEFGEVIWKEEEEEIYRGNSSQKLWTWNISLKSRESGDLWKRAHHMQG